MVNWAVNWATKRKTPIAIWYESKALEDALRSAGMTVYGAGDTPASHPHTCAMSIQAHGIGKNLVQWSECLVLTWPTNGTTVEQMLGRHHRPGQLADEIHVYYCNHHDLLEYAMIQSIRDAQYILSVTGNDQKLLLATTV